MEDKFNIFRKIKLPAILLVGALIFGVIGYHFLYPNESLPRLLYMTSITLSTVGYGDIFGIENSPSAIYYTLFVMLIGMGIVLYSVSSITAYVVEGRLEKLFVHSAILRRIRKVENHYIICGAGKTGEHVVREMYHTNHQFVVIESNPEMMDTLRAEFTKCLVIIGDATQEKTLEKAGIKRAKGLVIALSNDKDNLFLTLTARLRNPTIKIVSRAIDLSLVDKLKTAGADYVVSPNFIGGMRIASQILRPNVVSFLDRMLRGKDKGIRVGEVVLNKESPLIGKTIFEASFYENCGLNILAVGKEGSDDFRYNPPPDHLLEKGSVILFIGDNSQQKKLEDFALCA